MPDSDGEVQRDNRQVFRLVGIVVLALVLALFVFDNTDEVNIGWFFVGDSDVPLIVVLIIAALIGAALGWLLQRVRRR